MATIVITTVNGCAHFTLSGTGNVTVKEGTGSENYTLANELTLDTKICSSGTSISPTPRTITITGAGITAFKCSTLSALNISKDSLLTDIDCSGSSLTSLDVSGLTALKTLDCHSSSCYSSKLTSLNASGCGSLETLRCDRNKLTSLNLTGCFSLKILNCSENQLTNLDLNSFAAKHSFASINNTFIHENKIGKPDLGDIVPPWGKPDVFKLVFTYLTELDCSYNKLTTLDISKCIRLAKLACEYNLFTSLNISLNSLREISFGNSQLLNFNIKGCTMLEVISYYDSKMYELDFSKFAYLKRFECYVSNFNATLNLSDCPVLETILMQYPVSWYGAKIIVDGCTALNEIIFGNTGPN